MTVIHNITELSVTMASHGCNYMSCKARDGSARGPHSVEKSLILCLTRGGSGIRGWFS